MQHCAQITSSNTSNRAAYPIMAAVVASWDIIPIPNPSPPLQQHINRLVHANLNQRTTAYAFSVGRADAAAPFCLRLGGMHQIDLMGCMWRGCGRICWRAASRSSRIPLGAERRGLAGLGLGGIYLPFISPHSSVA